MSALGKSGIVPAEHMGNVMIPSDAAYVATLIFETAKEG